MVTSTKETPTVYMVMLFVGNTYGICGVHFFKDIPIPVSQEVYNYIRHNHYQRFRAWTQGNTDVSPETLASNGIVIPPKVVPSGTVTTDDIKPKKSRAERMEQEDPDEVLDGAVDVAPPVNPEDIASAFGNADDDPDNALAVAEEEVLESRRGKRGRK